MQSYLSQESLELHKNESQHLSSNSVEITSANADATNNTDEEEQERQSMEHPLTAYRSDSRIGLNFEPQGSGGAVTAFDHGGRTDVAEHTDSQRPSSLSFRHSEQLTHDTLIKQLTIPNHTSQPVDIEEGRDMPGKSQCITCREKTKYALSGRVHSSISQYVQASVTKGG